MKKFLILTALLLSGTLSFAQRPIVKTGIDVLKESNFSLLKGKRVGLITNPTGVDANLKSSIDVLNEAKELKLVALYAPEHGVRGDFGAGDEIDSYIDKASGVPVYSLYGKKDKPTPEILKGIDVLVYDIQDIGCRSFTYISTMGLAMEAAAENNIEFVVLDRPNPLGGNRIEGNLVEDKYVSFVSQYKIPYVYGLTCGELAKYLNEEGFLKNREKCKLTVVPMKNWKRKMTFEQTGLQWILPSPHIPTSETSQYYVTTGILGELGVINEGVGYTIPFKALAAEWMDAKLVADKMNDLNLKGVFFRPINYKPYYGTASKKNIHGVQIHITDFNSLNLMSLQFLFLQVTHQLYPEKNPFVMADTSRHSMFDKVCGTSYIRNTFSKNFLYSDIKDYLEKDIALFRKRSAKYHLYR
jgi:uncharacterized protein YbbC (DUF1343 family)